MASDTIDIKIKATLDAKGFAETKSALESIKKVATSSALTPSLRQQENAFREQAAAARASRDQMNALAASYRAQAAESNKVAAASRAQVAVLRQQVAQQKTSDQAQKMATASMVQYAQAVARVQAASGNYSQAAQTLARALNTVGKDTIAAARLQTQLITIQTKGVASAERAARETIALAQAQARLKAASGDVVGAQQTLIKALAQIAPNTRAAITAQTQLVALQGKVASGFASWIPPVSTATAALLSISTAIMGLNSAGQALSIAADFESAMAVLKANVAPSISSQEELAATMERVGEKAKELGNDLTLPAVSAGSAVVAINELVKGGLELEQAMAASLGTLQLAAAGKVDDAKAAAYATAALNGFKLAGDKAVLVADQFAAGAAATATDVKEMADALEQGGGLFANYQVRAVGGVEALTQFNTAVGVLATVGIKGGQAGTYIASAMERMANPTKEARGLMQTLAQQIGVAGDIAYDAQGKMRSFEDIMANVALATADMSDKQRDAAVAILFQTEGSKAVIPILNAMRAEVTNTTVGWNGIKEATTQTGAASLQAAAQMEGLNGATKKLQSQIETLALNAFEPALPLLANITLGMAEFAESMSGPVVAGATQLIDAIVSLGTFIDTIAVPAIYGAVAAATLYASVNSATLIPAIASAITSLAASTAAFTANAIAVAAAAAPYAIVAAAIAGVAWAWDNYNSKIEEANRKMLESREWWNNSADAVAQFESGLVEANPTMTSTANTIKILREQIEAETASLGERMLRGKVTQAQYDAEMAAINRKAGGLKAATGELERLMQAEVDATASSLNATNAMNGTAEGVQIIGRSAALTVEELQELATELDTIYSKGADALAKYVDTETAFYSERESSRQEYTAKMAELEAELAAATTDKQREGIQEQITATQQGYAAQEQAQAESYARQQAAQQAALGQMLINYVQNQVTMGAMSAEKGAEIAEAITKQFGIIGDNSGLTFMQMAADIDAWAASGEGSAAQLATSLGMTRDQAVQTQLRMQELERQYTAEVLTKMAGRPPEEIAEALRGIPAKVYAEVIVKESYVSSGGVGTAGRQEWEREMRPRRGGAMAGGGRYMTDGPTTILVGDNPGGREIVEVTPIGASGTTSVDPSSGLIRMAGGGSVLAGRRVGASVDAETGIVTTSRSRASFAGSDPVLVAERTKNKELVKIARDTQQKLVEIEEQTQQKIADINEKYWKQQLEGRRQLEYQLVTDMRDMELSMAIDDMDMYAKGADRKQIAERERQQAQLRELNKQAQAEARELAKNDAQLAEDVLTARERAARERVAIDAKYNEIAAQASKKDQEALRREYDEAIAALEERTNTEVDIAYQKAQQRERVKAEERAAVVSEAEKQKQEVVGAAIDQINAVDGASEEQKAAVVGALNDQQAAFDNWSATAAAAARSVVSAMEDAAKAIRNVPSPTIASGSSSSSGSSSASAAAAGGGTFVASQPMTITVGDAPDPEMVTVVPLGRKGQTRVGPGWARMAGGGSIWVQRREQELQRQNALRTGGSSFDLSEIDPAELDHALAQMHEVSRIVTVWAKKNKTDPGLAKKFADTVQFVSSAIDAAVTLRRNMQDLGPPLDQTNVDSLVEEVGTVADHFQGEIGKHKLNVGLLGAYTEGFSAVMESIRTMAEARRELQDVPPPLAEELIRSLAVESRIIVRILQSELVKLYQEERDALGTAAEALGSSTAILNEVISLRNNVKEVGPPIVLEKLRTIATEANQIVNLLQGQIDPASIQMREELERFASNVNHVVSVFNDIINLRQATTDMVRSPISVYNLQALLADAQQVAAIAAQMADEGVVVDERVEAFATITQQAVSTLSALADLRTKKIAPPIDRAVIKKLSDDTRATLYEFMINIIPLAEEHAAWIEQYANISQSAIAALSAMTELRIKDVGVPIDRAVIKKLSDDTRATLYEFMINIIPLAEEHAAWIEQYANISQSAIAALSAMTELRIKDVGVPIDRAVIKKLSDDTRATLLAFQTDIVPVTEAQAEAIANYSDAVRSASDALAAVTDLRATTIGSSLDLQAVRQLAAELRQVYELFSNTIVVTSEEQADDIDRYASAVGASVDALSAIASLRTTDFGSPLEPNVIASLAADAQRTYNIFKDKLVPVAEGEAEQAKLYADAVGSATSAINSVLGLTANLFADYTSPSDTQINRIVSDGNRLISALSAAADRYKAEGLEAAKSYADALKASTDAIVGTGQAVEALKYGNDYLIDAQVLAQFEASSKAVLAMGGRLGAAASQLDVSKLQVATAALNGWYDSLSKATSVPWGDLSSIAMGAGMAATGNTTTSIVVSPGAITIYAQPGENAQAIADRVLKQLNIQVGSRRS